MATISDMLAGMNRGGGGPLAGIDTTGEDIRFLDGSGNQNRGSGGGIDLGSILNQILGLAPGVISGINAGQAVGQGREAAAMADPFAGQRGQYQNQLAGSLGAGGQPNPYQTQLNQLLADPNSFKTDPGYQFALGQGQQAVERGSNALYGTGRTGSLGPELAKYTEGYAANAYDTRLNQLAGLSGQQQTYNTNQINQLLTASGANQGQPGMAGQMLLGGYSDRNAGYGQLLQGLSGGGYGGGSGGGLGGILNAILGRGGGGGSNIPSDFGGSSTDPWYDGSGMNPNADLPYNFGDWGGSVMDPWYG